MCAAPLAWNTMQKTLKLSILIPLHHFKQGWITCYWIPVTVNRLLIYTPVIML